MKCASCQHENQADAVFCEGCGVKLLATCAECGAELGVATRFCRKCGTPTIATIPAPPSPVRRVADYTPKHLVDKILQAKSALEGERKQVTVLFADIQGSMQLATQLDPEHWHALLERYFAILTDAVHRFEGTVNQYTGDGIMALFGAPIAHEDHAQRACYAALQARDQLRAFADELRLNQGLNFSFRIGLNSGDVVVGKIGDDLRMDYTAQGATVGIAQRIEQLAGPERVYLSEETNRLVAGFFQVRALGPVELRGLAHVVPLFELEAVSSARTRLEVAATRGLSRFVGRATEMETLENALARAQRGHGQVIGIVGEPGLGKSRLCFEFVESCRRRRITVVEAHCPAHGRNIPYLPILELFRNFFQIKAGDSAAQARKRIAGSLLLFDAKTQELLPVLFEFMGVSASNYILRPMDVEAKQRQLYELVHRMVRAQDALGSVTVILIDDLHWVDAGSDAFVTQLVSAVAGQHCLVVLNFRPEYVAGFATKAHYQQLPLIPLGEVPLRELVVSLIGQDDSVLELSQQIITWTTGNPFYTEELTNSLIEAGDLVGEPGHYRLMTRLDHLVVPTNVRAVLSARIDRLPESAKRLLQTAAVIGREFSGPLLEAISELSSTEYLAAMERLKTSEFIYERALFPCFEYSFKHPLTHEAAYGSQLQSRRARIHAAAARALEAHSRDKLDEVAALLAHHHEAAGERLQAAIWHRRAAVWAGLTDINAAIEHWLKVRNLAKQCEAEDETTALKLVVSACSQALPLAWRVGVTETAAQELFLDGCKAATRVGDFVALATLNAVYGAAVGYNQGAALDHVRCTAEAVRIADTTGDLAVRVGTRAELVAGFISCGQLHNAERVADEVIALASGDAQLGVEIIGYSPLMSASALRLLAIGHLRDPSGALQELTALRSIAVDAGHPEPALWAVFFETELNYALGNCAGAQALAHSAAQLSRDLGALNELYAAISQCDALASEYRWETLINVATDTLRDIRARATGGPWEPRLLALIGGAQLAMGNLAGGRASALEAVEVMRKTQSVWNPHAYAVLARVQLALVEPAHDVTATLDEYAAVLARTEFHLFEGELHELRAQLVGREGHRAEQMASLDLARNCYARFGMATHVARVDELMGLRASH